MSKVLAGFSAVFFWVLSAAAFAPTMPQLFEVLGQAGEHYEIVGTVCEQVAKLQAQEAYPAPRYHVITGIAYSNGDRVVGELDVVVFDKGTNKAILVAEVKCWRGLQGAMNKAREQRTRFQETLRRGRPVYLECTNHTCQFNRGSFDGPIKYLAIAQKGSRSFGFDWELPYSLENLMQLRQQLMACQSRGQCARPARR